MNNEQYTLIDVYRLAHDFSIDQQDYDPTDKQEIDSQYIQFLAEHYFKAHIGEYETRLVLDYINSNRYNEKTEDELSSYIII